MLSMTVVRHTSVRLAAVTLLSVGCAHTTLSWAQGFDLRSVCRAYPEGIKRAGCEHSMGARQALIEAQQGGHAAAPEQTAAVMATFSLQVVLALDTTIRQWRPLAEWAWDAGAHQASFHAIEAMGGERHPPRSMACPGGGSIGLVDNAGGSRTIASQHSLPAVNVSFGKDCRFVAGGPAINAAAPDVDYATAFSVPDEQEAQLTTHPMFLQFNSQPRLSSMPAWVPQGTAGELRVDGGRLRLYGETPEESDRGLGFIFWPQQAHAVDHRPYAGVSLRPDARTPGVGADGCIVDGRRCLMLDTNAAAPDRVIAHFMLGDNDVIESEAPSSLIHGFTIAVNTNQPLAWNNAGGHPVLTSGHLALHAAPVVPGLPGEAGATWDIAVASATVDGKPVLRVGWQRHIKGQPDKSGTRDLPQSVAVSLPHYCSRGETGMGCVALDYYPDYDM